jgi:hypothetical protein
MTRLKGIGINYIWAPPSRTSRLKGLSMKGNPQGLPESLGNFLFFVGERVNFNWRSHSIEDMCQDFKV